MEKHVLYDPVAQNDVSESPFSEPKDRTFGDEHTSRKSPSSYAKLGAAIVVFLFLYTVATVNLTMRVAHRDRRVGRRFLDTPVDNNYIVYDAKVMEQWEDVGQGSRIEYFTQPSEEIDRKWHEIVDHQNLGIREDVMKAMGREKEGIKLPDGTYYGSLMVFHHLHCLKNVYHALHSEYYGLSNLTGKARDGWVDQTTHYLHMLKEAIMCQADTTVLTMKWSEHSVRPIGNLTAPHECVNWDRLMGWVVPNLRDLTAEGWLVHPTYDAESYVGPAVVNGQLSRLPTSS